MDAGSQRVLSERSANVCAAASTGHSSAAQQRQCPPAAAHADQQRQQEQGGQLPNQALGAAPGSRVEQILDEYRKATAMPAAQMAEVRDAFLQQMEAALAQPGQGSLLMLPTWVDVLPDGHETGEYFAVDFGGSHLRLLHCTFAGEKHHVASLEVEEVDMPDQYHRCHADLLFDYIARRFIDFTQQRNCDITARPGALIGFCFSFPVDQSRLDAGRLIRWTKAYENEGAIGRDPVELLSAALQRQGCTSAHIVAMVNDTVGTLAQARYHDGPDACMALIMGTGTNAGYVEQLSNITKWLPKYRPRTSDMVVNMEWAGFASRTLPCLPEDTALDAASCNPGQAAFEKRTAGLYMGDLARRILLRLAREADLFGGRVPARLAGDPLAFTTRHLAACHQDAGADLGATADALADAFGLAPADVPLAARRTVAEVCQLVARRSARLTAAAVAGLLRHMGRDGSAGAPPRRSVAACDGQVFIRYAAYRELLAEGLADLLGEQAAAAFELKVTSGGSALGTAAVVAAAHNYLAAVYPDEQARWPSRKFPARRAWKLA